MLDQRVARLYASVIIASVVAGLLEPRRTFHFDVSWATTEFDIDRTIDAVLRIATRTEST
jgi:hypothetical protein